MSSLTITLIVIGISVMEAIVGIVVGEWLWSYIEDEFFS